MDLYQFPLSAFEVDCDGSACGSPRSVGQHMHPVEIGFGEGMGTVKVRDGKRVSYHRDGDGEVGFEPFSIQARAQGIRDAAAYINRMGKLVGSHEQRHKMAGVPEFLTQLADAVLAGVVKL